MALVFSEIDSGKKERTLGIELLVRNRAALHYKTERVAKTA